MKNILIVFGTRPEVIKLAPIILELRKSNDYKVVVCNTQQQKDLSNQTLAFFGIEADYNLDVMIPNQTLYGSQSRILDKLSEVIEGVWYDAIIVQGDTMSAFCGALFSFYNKIPLFHVEAGLRSYDLTEPFPEEALRQMISRIANLHFAPTKLSYDNLVRENIPANLIKVTGNTVVDALFCLSQKTLDEAKESLVNKGVRQDSKLVLLTVHRRENHGTRLNDILYAILALAQLYKDFQFILPVHPNPNVYHQIHLALSAQSNILLTKPLDYPELVCLIQQASLILTDSGGIQEEAPSFGVPILILRKETERMEGVEAGVATLVGADCEVIIKEASLVLNTYLKGKNYNNKNPYGDGKAANYIKQEIDFFFKNDS